MSTNNLWDLKYDKQNTENPLTGNEIFLDNNQIASISRKQE